MATSSDSAGVDETNGDGDETSDGGISHIQADQATTQDDIEAACARVLEDESLSFLDLDGLKLSVLRGGMMENVIAASSLALGGRLVLVRGGQMA